MSTADQYERRTAEWHVHEAAKIAANIENGNVDLTLARAAEQSHLLWALVKSGRQESWR